MPMRVFDLIRELIHGGYRVNFEMRVGLWLKPAGCVWNVQCRETPVGQIRASLGPEVNLEGSPCETGSHH